MLRKLLISGLAIAVLMTGYVSWPVLEAYRLRQAVRAGDVAVLDAKVDWVAVRRSLKQSIAELSSGRGSASGSSIEPERSLLSSFKLAMAPTVAERFIDSYVSADGIGKIDWARQGLASARGTVARLGRAMSTERGQRSRAGRSREPWPVSSPFTIASSGPGFTASVMSSSKSGTGTRQHGVTSASSSCRSAGGDWSACASQERSSDRIG